MSPTIGIIGVGVIGRAVQKMFPKAYGFDKAHVSAIEPPAPGKVCHIEQLSDLKVKLDYVFICVPTPHMEYDGLDMLAVEESIERISAREDDPIVIICSALQPGTADVLASKYSMRIVVQPEYFGETIAHPLTDLSKSNFLILGGDTEDVEKVIDLYQLVYNANIRIRKVSRLEAEVIKLSENRAIAFKVLQCQELYDACKEHGVDYNTIREAVYGDDPRFNLFWTFVFKNNRGLNSKCLPKDVYGWVKWYNGELTRFLIEYNKKLHGEEE